VADRDLSGEQSAGDLEPGGAKPPQRRARVLGSREIAKERRERGRDLSAGARREPIDLGAQLARSAETSGQRRGLPAPTHAAVV
jgi:hypothetical protein